MYWRSPHAVRASQTKCRGPRVSKGGSEARILLLAWIYRPPSRSGLRNIQDQAACLAVHRSKKLKEAMPPFLASPENFIQIDQQRFILRRSFVKNTGARPSPIVGMIDKTRPNGIKVRVLDPLPKHLLAPEQSCVRMMVPKRILRSIRTSFDPQLFQGLAMPGSFQMI